MRSLTFTYFYPYKTMPPITITYRRTSRLSIRIGKYGDVRVSAPIGCPREDVLKFVKDNGQWIAKAQRQTQERSAQRQAFFDQLSLQSREDVKEVSDRLLRTIPPLVDKYAKQMGVKPAKIVYRAATSFWGNCRPHTGIITFSAYLLLMPEWCIEYVVVHELAHLIVPNHSPRFYAVVGQYFPRWSEAKKEMKRRSRMELED